MQSNRNKNTQQDNMAVKKRNTLLAIILLLIVGFAANRFLADTGEEAGQKDYTADVTAAQAPTLTAAPEDEAGDTPDSALTAAPEEEEAGDAPESALTAAPEDEAGDTPDSALTAAPEEDASSAAEALYQFRTEEYLVQHFEKHGEEFDYATKEEYLAGANRVVQSPDALHKLEAEDGDDVYYLEETNEFVIVSQDGYIRTYFRPSAGIDYYNRQ